MEKEVEVLMVKQCVYAVLFALVITGALAIALGWVFINLIPSVIYTTVKGALSE